MARSPRTTSASLFEAGFLAGGAHAKALGLVEEIPYLKRQQRLIFARCGVIDPLSLEDYRRRRRPEGLERALAIGAEGDASRKCSLRACAGAAARASRPGSNGAPSPASSADQKYVVCNADEGDSGTFADRMLLEGDPFLLIEGMAIAGFAVGATRGLRLHPLRISARLRERSTPRSRRRARRGWLGAERARARDAASTSRRGSAPAPISAARRLRCSKASRASAGRCGRSRRCRRSKACSASRPSSTTC